MERVARALALLLGAVLWWRVGGTDRAGERVALSTSELPDVFGHATREAVTRVSLTIDSLPGADMRAWGAALQVAGTRVRWTTRTPLPKLALSAEPLADPRGGTRVSVLAPATERLSIRDQLGQLDSTLMDRSRVRVIEAQAEGEVRASLTRGTAAVFAGDSATVRAVLVLAAASWEGRFAAAALSESGWRVETDFVVADPSMPNAGPVARVRSTGASAPLDTSRFAAVVALDSSALTRGREIVRFVRSGGGLVMGSAASTLTVLGPLSPARRGATVAGLPGALTSATPRAGLSGHALTGLRADAVALEQRGGSILAAARREELGRVVGIGYEGTWRWRMEGGPGAMEAHREWWSLLMRSVARQAPVHAAIVGRTDPAPYADLVASLGPYIQDVSPSGGGRLAAEGWLLGAISGLLVLEWASRRLRGAA